MSAALAEFLKTIAEEKGLRTIQQFADTANIHKSIAGRLLKTGRAHRQTLDAVALHLGLDRKHLYELADVRESHGPYVPPRESEYLTQSQRRLVTRMILEIARQEDAGQGELP